MKCIVHITKECETVDECLKWYEIIKYSVKDFDDVHVNGQTTVKFEPSHPEGTPEEGPKP